jgi:hypothetical protein
MFIVPLFPALFANRLHADQTYHLRGSLCLLSPLWIQEFSSELLSVAVAYSTVSRCYQSKIHPHIGTLVRRHLRSAFVLYSNLWLLWCSMCDSSSQAILAKETFVAFTRYQFFWHDAWSSLLIARSIWKSWQPKFLLSYTFHCFGPISAFNRLHTITHMAWITLSNAQQKIGCNNN